MEEAQNMDSEEDGKGSDEENNLQPSKRACNRLSMNDEESAYAEQFQGSQWWDCNSSEEQESGHAEDPEDDQYNKDNLMFMDKNNDLDEEFGGGESNGVCCLFYHILSTQFFSSY